MINLIPPEGQKALRREYWLRVLSVWGFLISILCIIFTTLLIPRFMLTHSQLEQYRGHDDHTTAIEERYDAAEKEIVAGNMIVDYLSKQESRRSVSLLLNAIFEERTSHVEYKTISFERKDGAVEKVQIQGEADTRSDLIALRTALERSPLFAGVSIPLSDLARDADLPFVITVTVSDGV